MYVITYRGEDIATVPTFVGACDGLADLLTARGFPQNVDNGRGWGPWLDALREDDPEPSDLTLWSFGGAALRFLHTRDHTRGSRKVCSCGWMTPDGPDGRESIRLWEAHAAALNA